MPVGVMDFGNVFTTAAEMRQHLLRYLSDTNYLVEFHLGWTLKALSFALPARRVVYIGTEDSYQTLCIALASRLPRWNQLINEQLINFVDRRISAVLFRDGIDLYRIDSHDIYSETYYTAAIWNILEPRISEHRMRLAIHRIKITYCIGVGEGITTEEEPLLTRRVILTENRTGLPVVSNAISSKCLVWSSRP